MVMGIPRILPFQGYFFVYTHRVIVAVYYTWTECSHLLEIIFWYISCTCFAIYCALLWYGTALLSGYQSSRDLWNPLNKTALGFMFVKVPDILQDHLMAHWEILWVVWWMWSNRNVYKQINHTDYPQTDHRAAVHKAQHGTEPCAHMITWHGCRVTWFSFHWYCAVNEVWHRQDT